MQFACEDSLRLIDNVNCISTGEGIPQIGVGGSVIMLQNGHKLTQVTFALCLYKMNIDCNVYRVITIPLSLGGKWAPHLRISQAAGPS